jgi:hypothetical protein
MDIGNHADSNVMYRHKYCFLGRDTSNVIYFFPNWRHDKDRSALGKRHRRLNCNVEMNIELHVSECFALTI